MWETLIRRNKSFCCGNKMKAVIVSIYYDIENNNYMIDLVINQEDAEKITLGRKEVEITNVD